MLKFIIMKGSDDWMEHVYLEKKLLKRGWKNLTLQDNISSIDLYIGYIYYKQFLKLFGNSKINTKNILHPKKDVITDKSELLKNFKKYYPVKYNKYFPISFIYNDKTVISKNKIYVIRPAESFGGKDVYFVKDINRFKKIINKLKLKYSNIIISEYIKNPLLFKNKKTHVRIFYYIVYHNNKLHHYILTKGLLIKAKKDFKLENFEDIDIHDTHQVGHKRIYIFPDSCHFEQSVEKEIMNKIVDVLSTSGKILNDLNFKNWCYNNKSCYEIFGVDLIVTTDYDVKLLEINKKIGLEYANMENYKKLEKLIDYGIYNTVIKPIFYNEKPDTKYLKCLLP